MNSTFQSLLENDRTYKVKRNLNLVRQTAEHKRTSHSINAMPLPNIYTATDFVHKVVSGTAMDEVAEKTQKEIKLLKSDADIMTKQNEELKRLNEKMVERMEYLQAIIDKEASANTYYFNYPPKADYSGSHKVNEEKKGAKTPAGKKAPKEEDSELFKQKRMYEEQMDTIKKTYEQEIKQMKYSMATEIEQLTSMLSKNSN